MRVDCFWNVMAHAQRPDFVHRRIGRVNLNRRGRQFSRLLATEVCASALIMLDTSRSEVVWRVLATHYIRQFPLHFPSRASPCAVTFQRDCTNRLRDGVRAIMVLVCKAKVQNYVENTRYWCLFLCICLWNTGYPFLFLWKYIMSLIRKLY